MSLECLVKKLIKKLKCLTQDLIGYQKKLVAGDNIDIDESDPNAPVISAVVEASSNLTASASLNFPEVMAASSSDLTVSVTGAVLGDVIALGLPHAAMSTDNINYVAWVSSANVVTIRMVNSDSVDSFNPAAATFKLIVFK